MGRSSFYTYAISKMSVFESGNQIWFSLFREIFLLFLDH